MPEDRPLWTPTKTTARVRLEVRSAERTQAVDLTSADDCEITWKDRRAAILNTGPAIVRVRGERLEEGETTAIQKIAELRKGEEIAVDSVPGWKVYASMRRSAIEWMRTDFEFCKRKTEIEERARGAELLKEYLRRRTGYKILIKDTKGQRNRFRTKLNQFEACWTAATLIEDDRDDEAWRQAPEPDDEVNILVIVDLRGIEGRNFYTEEWAARLLQRKETAYEGRGTAAVAMLEFWAKAPDHRRLIDERGRLHENTPLIAELAVYRNPNAERPLPDGAADSAGLDEYGATGGECDKKRQARLIPVRSPNGTYVLKSPDGKNSGPRAPEDAGCDANTIEKDREAAEEYPDATLEVERDELWMHESGRALKCAKCEGRLVTIPEENPVTELLKEAVEILDKNRGYKDWSEEQRAALTTAGQAAEAMHDRELKTKEERGLAGRYPGVCGGAPVLKGTRINIGFALEALANWADIDDLTEQWRLDERFAEPAEAVKDGIRYMIRVFEEDEGKEAR